MTEILLFIAAGLLVALGGLMASLEAALDVTSRADLADLADEARSGAALRRIAADPDAHRTAVVFIRILIETAAAVSSRSPSPSSSRTSGGRCWRRWSS